MEPAKVSVLFAQFAYAGNGGVASVLPTHTVWWGKAYLEMKNDPRISKVALVTLTDTPITMTRNRAVKMAQDGGYDLLLMIDSDNVPDAMLGRDNVSKPFWKTTFDFVYERMQRGLPSVVCAPYCGSGDNENVFMFYWEGLKNGPDTAIKLSQYSRDLASQMSGILPVAAGPTGVTLYTVNAFDLTGKPYFYYEYTNDAETEKASTEDVTNFRDIGMGGQERFGEPVLFCNWDAWAGHMKPVMVNKPLLIKTDEVNRRFRDAIARNVNQGDQIVELNYGEFTPDAVVDEIPEEGPAVADGHWTRAAVSHIDRSEDGIESYRYRINDTYVESIGVPTSRIELEGLQRIVLQVAARSEKPLKILEIGSWVGESAVAMHNAARHVECEITCVDTWCGSCKDTMGAIADQVGAEAVYSRFLRNTAGLPITPIRGKSPEAADLIKDGEYDIVFIDAGHSYEECRDDIKAWFPKLAERGTLCGHDYCGSFKGVIQAVDEWCSERGREPKFMPGSSLWYLHNATEGHQPIEARNTEMSNHEHGVAMKKRRLFGQTVMSVGHQTAELALATLKNLTEIIANQAGDRALRALEVGTWVGESAVAITSGFKVPGSVLYCVDDFSGSDPGDPLSRVVDTLGVDKIREQWEANTQGLPVRLLEGKSVDIASDLDQSDLDLVYIDAGHTYESAKEDILAWLPHISTNGFLVGDDLCPDFPGVGQAVDEVFSSVGCIVRTFDNVWLVSKQEYLECLKSQA